MKRSKHLCFFLFLIVFSLTGCRKEEPNPELLDPIYQDLSKRASDVQKAYEDEQKNLEGVRQQIDKAEPNSPELRNARREAEKSEAKIVDFEQKARYYKIRAQRRLLVDRISYKAAFAKNEKWPDPREYSDYLVNNRLNEINLNWGARVPKLQERLVTANKKPAKEKEGGAKGEE